MNISFDKLFFLMFMWGMRGLYTLEAPLLVKGIGLFMAISSKINKTFIQILNGLYLVYKVCK